MGIVSLTFCWYVYWLFFAYSLRILLPGLRFLAWTSEQSCIPEVKELRDPCLKHRSALFFSFIFGVQFALSFFSLKFLSRPRYPSAFHLFKTTGFIFHRSDWTDFSQNTTTSLWSSFFKFRPDTCGKKIWFFRGLGSISESCFYSEPKTANVCAEFEAAPISSMACCGIVARTFFSQFCLEKKRWLLFLSR